MIKRHIDSTLIARLFRNSLYSRSFSTQLAESPVSNTLTKISSLPNGLRIATENSPGHFSAVGVYVDYGSRYENPLYAGASHMLDRLSFKSTRDFTKEKMTSTIESLGGQINCTSSREAIMYQGAVFNHEVKTALSLFSQVVRFPNITAEEVEEQKRSVMFELEDAYSKPESILQELFHVEAFQGNTLGHPLLCPFDKVDEVTPSMLRDVLEAYYLPERLVVAGIGVEHEKMCDMVNTYFGDMKRGTGTKEERQPARYTGGMRLYDDQGCELTHLLFGYEALSIHDEDIYALATLQMLMGGGGSFSAGGPGKGMYSRLYTNVLNQYHWVESCQSFNHCYTDSGLFGIHISCAPFYISSAVNVVFQEFVRMCEPLSEEEVSRAKNQLKSSLLMNSESRLIQLEDLGRQVQVLGKKVSARELCEKIDLVQPADVQRAAQRVVQGAQRTSGKACGMSVVGQGVFSKLPDLSTLAKKYGILGVPKF